MRYPYPGMERRRRRKRSAVCLLSGGDTPSPDPQGSPLVGRLRWSRAEHSEKQYLFTASHHRTLLSVTAFSLPKQAELTASVTEARTYLALTLLTPL